MYGFVFNTLFRLLSGIQNGTYYRNSVTKGRKTSQELPFSLMIVCVVFMSGLLFFKVGCGYQSLIMISTLYPLFKLQNAIDELKTNRVHWWENMLQYWFGVAAGLSGASILGLLAAGMFGNFLFNWMIQTYSHYDDLGLKRALKMIWNDKVYEPQERIDYNDNKEPIYKNRIQSGKTMLYIGISCLIGYTLFWLFVPQWDLYIDFEFIYNWIVKTINNE